MSDHERGQVDTSAAEVYDQLFVPALFGRFADGVAACAAVEPDDSVLDVACGTGALTRTMRSHTAGSVVGLDINSGMLAVARRYGGDIDYREGDASSLSFDDDSFDLATCQFGVMFLDDPAAGIAEMARVAERGAVAVWASIQRSAGYSAMQSLFRDELGADAAASLDAPFSMGVDGVLEAACERAGVTHADFATVEGTGMFASIGEWVTTEVRGWTLGETVSDEQLADLIAVAGDRLAEFDTGDGCVFGMAMKVATW